MPLERKKTLNVFKEANHVWGSYDDYPVGPKGTDPMPHLSRNRVPQPFFLVCEADQVLIQMAGEGELELKEPAPARMHLVPGDTVYIPAGVPSRLSPRGENLQLRLKAEPPVREAVAWYCAGCGELVHARAIAGGIPQEGYWEAVQLFNGDAALRTCRACAAVHPPVELGDIAWADVAAALRAEEQA
jgi:3-hydroxyanthranilate 3,4-dioxygenase